MCTPHESHRTETNCYLCRALEADVELAADRDDE